MTQRRVVVTGYGAITPLGCNVEEAWQQLTKGVGAVSLLSRFESERFKTRFACEIQNFNPQSAINKKDLRKYSLYQQYAMVACEEAVKMSHMVVEKNNRGKFGIVWDSMFSGIESLAVEISDFNTGDGTPRFNQQLIGKIFTDTIADTIATRYKFNPNSTVIKSLTNSSAIDEAYKLIVSEEANVVIAGGSEAPICPVVMGSLNAIQQLSQNNDNYTKASRPFDKERDGFVVAEGAGALVIESLEHALARKATIYAEIVGVSSYKEINSSETMKLSAKTAEDVMNAAIEHAGVKLNEITHINAYGASTDNDVTELKAIQNVFSNNLSKLYVTSTKSMTGHLLGAADTVEAIIAIQTMNNGLVPPTINLENRDPEIDEKINIVTKKAKKLKINCVMNNSFGIKGFTSTIFKKYV